MQNRRNYQLEMERMIAEIPNSARRPRLALHACCAPCSSAVLERLTAHFDIDIFFYNPNIAPEAEYAYRAAELRRLIGELPHTGAIDLTIPPYEPECFSQAVKGLEDAPEGGARCSICYALRLRRTGLYARDTGADFFTTTLSISPLKDAQRLNAIGARVAEEIGVPYLFSDFKKKDGYKRSIELSALYGLYRQNFCGCVYSRAAREEADHGTAER